MPRDNLILGSAGHIDHGKTSLVRALTGVDTDRLPEERARGITIELGFAPLELAPGLRVGVIDVPGHEGLVRTMVAGATGIDLVLLAVAADEGAMPQTREHLAIVDLLGIDDPQLHRREHLTCSRRAIRAAAVSVEQFGKVLIHRAHVARQRSRAGALGIGIGSDEPSDDLRQIAGVARAIGQPGTVCDLFGSAATIGHPAARKSTSVRSVRMVSI